VGLHIAHISRVHARTFVYLPHQPLLRRRRRRDRRRLCAVRAGPAAHDVAVRPQRRPAQRIPELKAAGADGHEQYGDGALGAHEAVGCCIERARVAGRRDGAAGQGSQEDVAGQQGGRPWRQRAVNWV
jgi:hypothetical protein